MAPCSSLLDLVMYSLLDRDASSYGGDAKLSFGSRPAGFQGTPFTSRMNAAPNCVASSWRRTARAFMTPAAVSKRFSDEASLRPTKRLATTWGPT